MSRLTRSLAAAFAFGLGLAAAAPAVAGDAGAAIGQARALIDREMARTLAPAVSVAVARDGRLVWTEAIGCADLELSVPVERTTRLRVGSVSKALTSAALGRLVEQGRLDLDAPVQRYVPDFPKKAWPVTTRELAGHLAGVRHYEGSEFEIRDHFPNVRSALAIFDKDSLLFEPGTRFSYSSYGWNLISAVLEAASGEPFLALMQETVFDPAGLAHTAPDDPLAVVPGRARFYTRDEKGEVVNAGFVDNSYKWAGGGFVSTAEDLVTFAFALLDGKLLRPETVRLLWTSQRTSDGKETGYGLGWFVKSDEKGRRRVYHSGGAKGGTAFLVIYPDERLAAAMIVNSDESFTGQALRIAEMFLDGK